MIHLATISIFGLISGLTFVQWTDDKDLRSILASVGAMVGAILTIFGGS